MAGQGTRSKRKNLIYTRSIDTLILLFDKMYSANVPP